MKKVFSILIVPILTCLLILGISTHRIGFNEVAAEEITLSEEASRDLAAILNLVYPIGRGFLDFTDTDYSNYLGFTWERELVGMTPVGLDTSQAEFNTIGKTGGEKTHKLTVNEMPSHTHIQNAHNHVGLYWNNNGYPIALSNYNGTTTGYITSYNKSTVNTNYMQTGSATATNQNTGGNQAHNNLQPYKVVAYWKRVA